MIDGIKIVECPWLEPGAISGEIASKPINRPIHSQAAMELPDPLPVATTETERRKESREHVVKSSGQAGRWFHRVESLLSDPAGNSQR